MDTSRHASVELLVRWQSGEAAYAERRRIESVSFRRDHFPGDLGERLARCAPGEAAAGQFAPGQLAPAHDPAQVRTLPGSGLRQPDGRPLEPRVGRFYPRGLLSGVADVFVQDRRPFRFLGREAGGMRVDLNHPLARYPLGVEARILAELPTGEAHGGRCNDLAEALTAGGPGLQAAYPGVATDFFAGDPFAREDGEDDAAFYGPTRLVNHLDEVAMGHVRALYGRLLTPGMRVLDLMSSWSSHLPESLAGLSVTGLGMNRSELDHNPRLTGRLVHDLNRDPGLPLATASFDAAICTVSVEYLIRPREVFAEVARVLRPGAPFVLTFSDRWFPPKVIRLWTELHPFERMGLVLEYFRAVGGFEGLHTESVRGWARPADDKYAHRLAHSDPVYAVWAVRAGGEARRAA
jgi:hypothetical protein